jgi:hypothetical protein
MDPNGPLHNFPTIVFLNFLIWIVVLQGKKNNNFIILYPAYKLSNWKTGSTREKWKIWKCSVSAKPSRTGDVRVRIPAWRPPPPPPPSRRGCWPSPSSSPPTQQLDLKLRQKGEDAKLTEKLTLYKQNTGTPTDRTDDKYTRHQVGVTARTI